MRRALLRVAVFLALFAASFLPAIKLVEVMLTQNVSSDPPPYFPVLARSPEGRFVVARLQNVTGQTDLVLEVADRDLERINRDLGSRISADNRYPYFRVLQRGRGYTDVSLEVPTKGDFWPKSWYRIQRGSIHPQRILNYGPIIAMLVFPLSLLAGALGVYFCNRVMRQRKGVNVI